MRINKLFSFVFIGVLVSVVCFKWIPQKYRQTCSFFNSNNPIDTLEFAPGHPAVELNALQQLQSFPAAQFSLNHNLLPNFLWMDPVYLGGLLQPGYKMATCVERSTKIQAELAFNWHYYFLVSSNLKIYTKYQDTSTFAGAWVKYANLHPELPAAAISFWAQIQPVKSGGSCTNKSACIISKNLPDYCYLQNKQGEIVSKKFISPVIPTAILQCDFNTQSMYVDSLLIALKRPLQMINENGEVFRLYDDELIEADQNIMKEKNKFPNLTINQFQAMKRIERELSFKNSFMPKPQLKNCLYTEYAIDGQNHYRHDYKTMREIHSKINNQYYATPDFYPRYPYNWKEWQGPWHGLEWIEICRKIEIDAGDQLFSPFVAAGWDSVECNNIRPAQWLGLLKILAAMGAEFYYSGFFNTGKSVAKPENYIWQAVMPAYAQGITSFYENILRDSKIIVDENMIRYPESDVPVVIRKSTDKKIWIIACTWQTGNNYNKNVAEYKTIWVNLGHKKLKINARRQGSVYYYSEENKQPLCFQIDGWHEYKHPWYWKKNIVLEAELYSKNNCTEKTLDNDYSNTKTWAIIDSELNIPFNFHGLNNHVQDISFRLNSDADENSFEVFLDNVPVGKINTDKLNNFTKFILPLNHQDIILKNGKHQLKLRPSKAAILLDEVELIMGK